MGKSPRESKNQKAEGGGHGILTIESVWVRERNEETGNEHFRVGEKSQILLENFSRTLII